MIADTYEHDGVTVEIRYDDDAEHANPRECDQLGVMLCSHPRYNLGDEQVGRDGMDTSVECDACSGSGWVKADSEHALSGAVPDEDGDVTCAKCGGDGEIELGLFEYLKRYRGATVVLPLFLYDHSGISISAGENMGSFDRRNRVVSDAAGWDVSSVGVIFDTKETREATGVKPDPEEIERQLRGEVEEYDLYLTGQVYGYVVGEDTPFEESVWGFLGDKYVNEEAKEAASRVSALLKREAQEAAYWAACDVVTVAA